MEGGLIGQLALIRTGAAKGDTSISCSIFKIQRVSNPAMETINEGKINGAE